MTGLQKIELQRSEIRSQIAAELDKPETDRDHNLLESLTTRAKNVEVEYRAALVSQEQDNLPPDSTSARQDDKLVELRERLDFQKYVKAASQQVGVMTGAEREYNDEIGLELDRFPLEILAQSDVEERAKRDGDPNTTPTTWVDRVFGMTAASHIGVSFRSVNPGVTSIPVTTAGGSFAQRGRDESASESTYTFGLTELKPTRASMYYTYNMEDAARVPGLAAAMRRDMQMSLPDSIDKKVFNGDTGANENSADITGLRTASITEVTLTQANKVKYDKWLELFAALIDGTYCKSFSDIKVAKSVGTARLWYSKIANDTASNDTIAKFLAENGIMGVTREGIDTATSNGDFGAYVGLAGGQMGTAVAAVWNSGQLIRDIYSSAAKAETRLILHYLWDFAIARTANFRRVKYVS